MSDTSNFDPFVFLNAESESGFDTEYTPVPAKEYIAAISKVTPRALEDGRVVMDVQWKFSDAEATEATGLPENSVRQTVWLDTNEHGGLAKGKGKNVALGRLLSALGMNDGSAFSFNALVGKMGKIKVDHKLGKAGTEREGQVEAYVKAVAGL